MQIEVFCAEVKDTDYLIYNSIIDGEMKFLDELLAKSTVLKAFKAVKGGMYGASKSDDFSFFIMILVKVD